MANRVSELLKVKYPILLGGMSGVGDAKLAMAVSEAGGLGTISAARESREGLERQIREFRALSKKPFAVNVPVTKPDVQDIIAVVIEQKVPVVITAAGSPSRYTAELKHAGITVLHVIPCSEQARKAEEAGVDAVIAEGFESGGVASPFEIGTLVLIPKVVDTVRIPVIAAGGIGDARSYAAIRMLGAEGISVGTAFLATVECSNVGEAWKKQLLDADDTSTMIVARKILGVRVLKNSFARKIDLLADSGKGRQELMQAMMQSDRKGVDDGLFPCGQAAAIINRIQTVKDVIEGFVRGSEELIKQKAAEDQCS